jgi:NAD(P)H-flavin reductase
MNNQSPKRTFICECTNFEVLAAGTVSLEFDWPGPAPVAGQFFMIKPGRTSVFLARPFSVAGWVPREDAAYEGSEDRRGGGRGCERGCGRGRSCAGGILTFFVTRRGTGSAELSEMRRGEKAELSGPLGNRWPLERLPKGAGTDAVEGMVAGAAAGAVALVGGGVGISPLLFLALELKERPFDFFAGFKTRPFGLERLKGRTGGPRSLVVATEDGSDGFKGRVLDFFSPVAYSGVFACGPEPMLREVAARSAAAGIPCFVSAERRMACGVGACLGCKVETKIETKIETIWGSRRCCADGPIFFGAEIRFGDTL